MQKKLRKLRARYAYSIILMREMVRTDFKIKYQESVLGYFWSVLRPLFLFGILYLVFTVGLRVGDRVENWPVALLAGIVLWQFFTDVTKGGLKAIVKHGSLLRKIKLPRYIVVVSGTVTSFISLLINFTLVIVFAVISGVPLLPTLPLVILIILQVFVFSLGLAFLLAAIEVKFRDVEHVWEILLRGGFYASAIIFPMSMIAERGETGIFISKILLMNPIAQAIQDFRHVAISPDVASLWTISGGDLMLYIIPVTITIITFVFGAWYFRRRSPYFAEDI